MKKNTFVEGTIIASMAIIFTKFLGALYVIPFYSIIGEQGGALYSYAYNIYNLFLNISTAGIPIAMSKIISEYNALGLYEAKERSYKIGRNIILLVSVIAFLILFVFAEEIALLIKGNAQGGNSIADIGFVIRSVSLCLIIIPFLSVTKGYLQGHKFIAPTSTSQVIEQIVRIIVILLGSYLAINVLNFKISVGVAIALVGAFIGGLVAYLYLRFKINVNKRFFNLPKAKQKDKVKTDEIIKKIIKYSLPLIIVSIATNVYSITDLTFVIRGLSYLGYSAAESETIASIIATWGEKICMIINAVAIGISISLIPHMVSSYVKRDYADVNRKFNQAIGVIFVTALPMTLGISILSGPFYTVFYGASAYGTIILRFLVFTAFLASIHIVISSALQSLNKFKIVYLSTIVGFLVDASLDIPLIILFEHIGIYPYYGAIAATIVGYSVSFAISLSSLKKDLHFTYASLLNMIKKLVVPIIAMLVPLIILNTYFNGNFTSRFMQVPIILLNAFVSGSIFIYMCYRNGVLYDAFGKEYVNKIVNKLGFFGKVLKLKK